jgi:ribose 5-phosphate isomerase A
VDREALKAQVARAAIELVSGDLTLGVGAGTTVEHFVRELGRSGRRPSAAVAAAERTSALLEAEGVRVVHLAEELLPLPLYIDGADEVDAELRLIKGGGGALTREKILATASARFVCIVDETKLVHRLGGFPLAIEVVRMAVPFVQRELRSMGGVPKLRDGFESDNGAVIVDVTGLDFSDPVALEQAIHAIPGVIECGIFARRPADLLLVGTESGVRRIERGR